ncbi:YciI family protein [Psychrobacter lutiphocae]|uniref:YciI family protein n=1 Tax=Psychrobacter lutiphocae TaxID=540500 RepID=UPI00037B986D
MPAFMIVGHEVANPTELRQQTRPEHVARLKQLAAEGRIIVAGPTPIEHGADAMSGSLIVAEFDNLQAAQDWANEEPFLKAGIYSHVDIRPFVQVLP